MKTPEKSQVKLLGLIAAYLGLQLVASATASASPQATEGNAPENCPGSPLFFARRRMEWHAASRRGPTGTSPAFVQGLRKAMAREDRRVTRQFSGWKRELARTSVPPEDALQFELASVGASYQGKIFAGSQSHPRSLGAGRHRLFHFNSKGDRREPPRAPRLTPSQERKAPGKAPSKPGTCACRSATPFEPRRSRAARASIDSLDQGIQGIPASRVSEKDGEVKFEILAFNAQYTGTLSTTKNEINGHWDQNNNLEVLNFAFRPRSGSAPSANSRKTVSVHRGRNFFCRGR